MRLNVNDWIDGWFLSLSDNPTRLDARIRSYESARAAAMISSGAVLMMQMLLFLQSGDSSDFIWIMFLLILVVDVQTDIYTKVLKLLRHQQHRDPSDAT